MLRTVVASHTWATCIEANGTYLIDDSKIVGLTK